MIKILQRQILFILTGLLFQTSVNATTIREVVNPGDSNDIQPNIRTALNSAVDGDVISLPAGTFVFNKNIDIRKLVSIRGAGIGKTILYRSESVPDTTLDSNLAWNGMLRFIISRTTSSIVVSDITFKSKYPSIASGDGGSMATDLGIVMVYCVDFVITRCRFEYFGEAAIYVDHHDTLAKGLICNNEFYHNSKGFDGNGLGYGVEIIGDNDQWISNPNFGSSNFIFIEDNIFDYHRHAIAAGGAGLYVARNNTILNSFIFHAIDTHNGRRGNLGNGNYYSTRAVEIYNNTITNVAGLTERAIAIRGAEALVYNNIISGFRFGCGINIDTLPWGAAFPGPKYTTGYLSRLNTNDSLHTGTDQVNGDGDLFYWGNTFTPRIGDTSSKDLSNYQPQYFKLNRDFHTVAKPLSLYTPYPYPHPLKSLLPPTPVTGVITQPTCAVLSGSVVLSGLPAGNWILNPGNIAGTGSSYTVTGLSPGTYNFKVTNALGHNSAPTSDIVINALPALHSKIKLFIEGFYNSATNKMIPDTVNVFLRNSVSPYSVIDSAKSLLDSSGSGDFFFTNASTGKYYLQIIHRNSVETWSRSGGDSLIRCSLFTYDFTNDVNKSYGSNMIQADTSPVSYAIYSGDVNQDGIIDAADLSGVENDVSAGATGYISTDLNGDETADASDLSIVENNIGMVAVTP